MGFKKVLGGAAVAPLAAGMVGVGSSAANAALGGKGCTNGSQLLGDFRDNAASSSWELFDCGTVSVRVGYRIYSGGPVYYTGWVYGSSNASTDPGNIRQFSHHDGTYIRDGQYFSLSD